MPLLGKRILLRALENRDLDALWQAQQDFDLQLITDGDAPPVSDVQTRAFWEDIIANPGVALRYFAIEPLAGNTGEGQLVGACSLQQIDMRNRHAELGIFMISTQRRGQGYGTDAVQTLLSYAFDVVRLDKVHLGVYDFNEAGIRSYERVGFRYEGRLRQQIYYQGRYWDEWPMGILRAEWDVYCQPPAEGLRPYHPADQEQVVGLLQKHLPTPDSESARVVLRRWWRQIDRSVYVYQMDEKLIGVLTRHNDTSALLDMIVSAEHRSHIEQAVQHSR
jgi:RimJ/RimL family protein N-acetyltransferase